MPTKNFYDTLGVSKTATEAEIKKAYKKKALEFHPDRNKWDKKAEAKFKEINEAYQTVGDTKKRKEYDQFGSGGNPFGWMGWAQSSSRNRWASSWAQAGFGWFEDIFSQFGGGVGSRGNTQGFEFDIWDLFGSNDWDGSTSSRREEAPEPAKKPEEVLDVTKTIEIPFLDFLFPTTVDVETVYGKHLRLKVKAGTKPGTKYKISGKWRSSDGKTGDMYVIVDAKMPSTPLSPIVEKMVEAIRYQI